MSSVCDLWSFKYEVWQVIAAWVGAQQRHGEAMDWSVIWATGMDATAQLGEVE